MDGFFQSLVGFVLGLLVLSSLIVLLFRWRRWGRPLVEFRDLVYNKAGRQLELYVANSGNRAVYVNPSLRLMHFLDPEEWRGRKSNGGSDVNMVDGRFYGVDSVIKGYTLVGESPGAVMVGGNSVEKIVYPLDDDIQLSVCDNVRVDSHCGFHDASGELFIDTLRVSVKDGQDGLILDSVSSCGGDSNRLFKTISTEDASPCNYISGVTPSDGPEYNPDFCVLSGFSMGHAGRKVEGVFPLQAVCVCCGREKWLEWVVDGNYVCAGCKAFLEGGFGRDTTDSVAVVGVEKPASSRLDVGSLKPRQRDILNLVEHENNLTVKKISRLLSVNESTVAADLKFLMKGDLVGRVQVGRRYLYHLA